MGASGLANSSLHHGGTAYRPTAADRPPFAPSPPVGSASAACQVRPIRGVGNLLVQGRSITMFSAASASDDVLFTGRWLAVRFVNRFHRWPVHAAGAFVADTLPSDIRPGTWAFRFARHAARRTCEDLRYPTGPGRRDLRSRWRFRSGRLADA